MDDEAKRVSNLAGGRSRSLEDQLTSRRRMTNKNRRFLHLRAFIDSN